MVKDTTIHGNHLLAQGWSFGGFNLVGEVKIIF